MKSFGGRLLTWTPRVLTILFAVFISLFALDIFSEPGGFWLKVLGLLMHLIPTFLIIVILIVSWRQEWIAAIVFFGLAAAYVIASRGNQVWQVYAFLCGPLILVAALFLVNWLRRSRHRIETGEGK